MDSKKVTELDQDVPVGVTNALAKVDLNIRQEDSSKTDSTGNEDKSLGSPLSTCAHCSKSDPAPTKRCSKRHQKCLKKIFCDKACEEAAHKNKASKVTAKVDEEGQEQEDPKMSEADKAAKAKKKKAKKAAAKGKKASADQFWWNNSVYASW